MEESNVWLSTFRFGTPIVLIIMSVVLGAAFSLIKKILRQVKFTNARVCSMDYALESTMNNGYKTHRDKKLRDIVDEDSFINQKGNPLKI